MKIFRLLPGLMAASLISAACSGRDDDANKAPYASVPRDTAMIDSIPSCQACAIVLIDSLALGTAKDVNIPARVPGFLRDGHGKYYLTFEGWSNQLVLAYDSLGAFAGVIGHYGQGPGEYRHTTKALLGPGDSLFVFEGNLIGHVFAPDGKYVRRADVAVGRPFAIASDRTGHILALKAESWPPTGGAQQVIRNAPNAQRADSFEVFSVSTGRSFEVSSGKEKYSRADVLNSQAYGGLDGTVWTMNSANYRLEQHDSRGVPRKLFGVRVSGEPDPIMNEADIDSARVAKRFVPTQIVIRSPKQSKALRPKRWLDVDDAGLLWIGRQVAAPGWDTIATKAQKLSPNEAPQEETIPREIEDRRYHTIVEVIDPKIGQLLARIQLPFLGERVAAGFVGRVVADEDGFYKPSVYRLHLKR